MQDYKFILHVCDTDKPCTNLPVGDHAMFFVTPNLSVGQSEPRLRQFIETPNMLVVVEVLSAALTLYAKKPLKTR